MEENKKRKTSISIGLLLVAIIIIIAMGVLIYKTYNEKIIAVEKNEELQSQAKELNDNINNLQEKINSISETINSNNSIKNSTTDANQTVVDTEFTDKQVKDTFQIYLNLIDNRANSPESFLKTLNLKNDNNNIEARKNGYMKTNIKYTVFKETLLSYVTKKCYEENFSDGVFIDEDGFLCYLRDVGATGMNYKINSIVKTSNNVFNAIVTATPSDKVEIKYEFGIENNNGKCLIDYCNQISTKSLE